MCPEMEKIYESSFMHYGFTPRQFLDIADQGEVQWSTYQPGECIHAQGSQMDTIHYLLEGRVHITDGEPDRHGHYNLKGSLAPGKGGWIGEFFDPLKSDTYDWIPAQHHWAVGARCAQGHGPCKTMTFLRSTLDRHLRQDPRLAEAAAKAQIADLWGKLNDKVSRGEREKYEAMLMVCKAHADLAGVLERHELEVVSHFARLHKIDEEQHKKALLKVGWSEEAFNAAKARGENVQYCIPTMSRTPSETSAQLHQRDQL